MLTTLVLKSTPIVSVCSESKSSSVNRSIKLEKAENVALSPRSSPLFTFSHDAMLFTLICPHCSRQWSKFSLSWGFSCSPFGPFCVVARSHSTIAQKCIPKDPNVWPHHKHNDFDTLQGKRKRGIELLGMLSCFSSDCGYDSMDDVVINNKQTKLIREHKNCTEIAMITKQRRWTAGKQRNKRQLGL